MANLRSFYRGMKGDVGWNIASAGARYLIDKTVDTSKLSNLFTKKSVERVRANDNDDLTDPTSRMTMPDKQSDITLLTSIMKSRRQRSRVSSEDTAIDNLFAPSSVQETVDVNAIARTFVKIDKKIDVEITKVYKEIDQSEDYIVGILDKTMSKAKKIVQQQSLMVTDLKRHETEIKLLKMGQKPIANDNKTSKEDPYDKVIAALKSLHLEAPRISIKTDKLEVDARETTGIQKSSIFDNLDIAGIAKKLLPYLAAAASAGVVGREMYKDYKELKEGWDTWDKDGGLGYKRPKTLLERWTGWNPLKKDKDAPSKTKSIPEEYTLETLNSIFLKSKKIHLKADQIILETPDMNNSTGSSNQLRSAEEQEYDDMGRVAPQTPNNFWDWAKQKFGLTPNSESMPGRVGPGGVGRESSGSGSYSQSKPQEPTVDTSGVGELYSKPGENKLEGIDKNQLKFLQAIGQTETSWNQKEAYTDRNNAPNDVYENGKLIKKGNANVRNAMAGGMSEADARAQYGDYGYFQMNKNDVDNAIKKYNLDPDIAKHLYGGGPGGQSSREEQVRAMHHYLQKRWPELYENLKTGDPKAFEAARQAMGGTYFGLRDHWNRSDVQDILSGNKSPNMSGAPSLGKKASMKDLQNARDYLQKQLENAPDTDKEKIQNQIKQISGLQENLAMSMNAATESKGKVSVSDQAQKERPDHFKGKLTVEGKVYDYGTGAPGAYNEDMHRGSIPYGTFPLEPGLHGSRNPRFNQNSFGVENMHDPKWNKERTGVLLHSARDLDKLYSAGCLAIRKDQWPAFKEHLMDMMKRNGGKLTLSVRPDGSAEIVPTSSIQTVSADKFAKDTQNERDMSQPPSIPPGSDPTQQQNQTPEAAQQKKQSDAQPAQISPNPVVKTPPESLIPPKPPVLNTQESVNVNTPKPTEQSQGSSAVPSSAPPNNPPIPPIDKMTPPKHEPEKKKPEVGDNGDSQGYDPETGL